MMTENNHPCLSMHFKIYSGMHFGANALNSKSQGQKMKKFLVTKLISPDEKSDDDITR